MWVMAKVPPAASLPSPGAVLKRTPQPPAPPTSSVGEALDGRTWFVCREGRGRGGPTTKRHHLYSPALEGQQLTPFRPLPPSPERPPHDKRGQGNKLWDIVEERGEGGETATHVNIVTVYK